jgi:hypothetical protein
MGSSSKVFHSMMTFDFHATYKLSYFVNILKFCIIVEKKKS